MELKTSRLRISPLKVTDADSLFFLSNEPGLTLFQISDYRMRSVEHAWVWIQEKLAYLERNRIGTVGVYLDETGILIGLCALKYLGEEKNSDVEIMFRLSQRYWGQGYATELARALVDYAKIDLKVRRLVATVDPKNEKSKRVLEKIGFSFESVLKIQDLSEELYALNLT